MKKLFTSLTVFFSAIAIAMAQGNPAPSPQPAVNVKVDGQTCPCPAPAAKTPRVVPRPPAPKPTPVPAVAAVVPQAPPPEIHVDVHIEQPAAAPAANQQSELNLALQAMMLKMLKEDKPVAAAPPPQPVAVDMTPLLNQMQQNAKLQEEGNRIATQQAKSLHTANILGVINVGLNAAQVVESGVMIGKLSSINGTLTNGFNTLHGDNVGLQNAGPEPKDANDRPDGYDRRRELIVQPDDERYELTDDNRDSKSDLIIQPDNGRNGRRCKEHQLRARRHWRNREQHEFRPGRTRWRGRPRWPRRKWRTGRSWRHIKLQRSRRHRQRWRGWNRRQWQWIWQRRTGRKFQLQFDRWQRNGRKSNREWRHRKWRIFKFQFDWR